MRRLLVVAGASVVVHTLLCLSLLTYRTFVLNVGEVFLPSNHLEDMPQMIVVGFAAVGIVVIGMGLLVDRLARIYW